MSVEVGYLIQYGLAFTDVTFTEVPARTLLIQPADVRPYSDS